VYVKEKGNIDQGYAFSKRPGIYTMNAKNQQQAWLPEGEYQLLQ
jgi:hypothetical protein